MLYGIKAVVTYLSGTDNAGRNFPVYPDDTFIVSYPRSGNTWTRFLVANLVYPDGGVSFANIEKLIPDSSSQSTKALKRTPRPRIIKSHEYFDHRYPKTIYIVRDPPDVALSYYSFNRRYMNIDNAVELVAFVDGFVSGRLRWRDGTWAENVASWVYTREHSSSFLLLRYEEMLRNTMAELQRIAAFMGIEPEPARLQRAIDLSSADRIRKLEKLQEKDWLKTCGFADRRAKKNLEIPFVGKAKAGGWRTALPDESVRQIESAWGELMIKVGYELVTASQPQMVA